MPKSYRAWSQRWGESGKFKLSPSGPYPLPHRPVVQLRWPWAGTTPDWLYRAVTATIDTRRAMAELVLANLESHFTGQQLPTAVV
jgi:hypothetical protein